MGWDLVREPVIFTPRDVTYTVVLEVTNRSTTCAAAGGTEDFRTPGPPAMVPPFHPALHARFHFQYADNEAAKLYMCQPSPAVKKTYVPIALYAVKEKTTLTGNQLSRVLAVVQNEIQESRLHHGAQMRGSSR